MKFSFRKGENKIAEEGYQYGWRDRTRDFFRSWKGAIILYLVIPGVIANFWLFRYDDFGSNCHVKIHPSITEWNNLDIKKGIRLLKEKSVADYRDFCQNVRSISPELACGGMGGGCFTSHIPDQITISTILRPVEYHTEFTSGMIVHEVCHVVQWKEQRPMDEGECYAEMCRVLQMMGVRSGYHERCRY